VTQADQVRGHRRLAALGLPPQDAPIDEAVRQAAHRRFYEAERARYTHLAAGGLHLAPGEALYGMVVAAIKDANGWDKLPPDWLDEQPSWPMT
jgi:hypothetical protein